ncbi:MAG TPA: tyrosine-type recombinase/integrase, partial [Terriglobales bacterium]|nr:tyrosine-type recombinase/integrase [Terriglobales bacterium]
EARGLSSSSINQRLAAVRRLAYEAADCGSLSPELAAGIRRVKGMKQLGHRAGNWLTLEQCSTVLDGITGDDLRAKRDRAMIAILIGCGLRRAELAALEFEHIQTRQGHWAIVDLVGKGGHIRTVPIPRWACSTTSYSSPSMVRCVVSTRSIRSDYPIKLTLASRNERFVGAAEQLSVRSELHTDF